MDVEVGVRYDLEKRLSVKVDVVEVTVLLVVDVRVSESALEGTYPLEMIRPLDFYCSCLLRFTPWMRIRSPHLSVFCSRLLIIYIYLNKL